MVDYSFMSRTNFVVNPGGKIDLAQQFLLIPLIRQLEEGKRRAS